MICSDGKQRESIYQLVHYANINTTGLQLVFFNYCNRNRIVYTSRAMSTVQEGAVA